MIIKHTLVISTANSIKLRGPFLYALFKKGIPSTMKKYQKTGGRHMRISCRQQSEDCPAFSTHGFASPASSIAVLAGEEAVFDSDDIFREKESAR